MKNCNCNPKIDPFEFPIYDSSEEIIAPPIPNLLNYIPNAKFLKLKIILDLNRVLDKLECGIQESLLDILLETSLVDTLMKNEIDLSENSSNNNSNVDTDKILLSLKEYINALDLILGNLIAQVIALYEQLNQDMQQRLGNYVIITKADYDALESYSPNVVYFIVDNIPTGSWKFGDPFPIKLA